MDCELDECEIETLEDPSSRELLAVNLTGTIALLNALGPTLLWWLWRRPDGDIDALTSL